MTTATAPAPATTSTPAAATTTTGAATGGTATTNTTAAKTRAPKQPRAPLLSAEKNIQKQIEVIQTAQGLTDEHRQLVVDALSGLHLMISKDLDALADPTNPPAPDSAWGKVIALGRSRRGLAVLQQALAPGDAGDDDEGSAADKAGF